MDFEYSEEQNMLRDTLAGYLARHYDFEARCAAVRSASGWRPEVWRALAQELSIFGAAFPESLGGLGGGAIEHAIVMEELGKVLALEPYLGTLVIGGGLLKQAGGALAQEFVPRIMAGEAVLAFAQAEPGVRYALTEVATTAKRQADGYVLNGRKSVVIGAPWATQLVVVARSGGAPRDAEGITLLLVDKDSNGIRTQDYPTIDGGRAAEVFFDEVRVPAGRVIGTEGAALPLLERVADEAVCALCAEAVGCMRRLLADTVAYACQRKQFGVPIASFQVLQHRMADMFVALEQSIALTLVATLKLDSPPAERALAASAAKVQIGSAGRFIGQAAIQIHGGMGITEELALGHYFKRLTAIGSQFGTAEHHLRRYADLSLAAA
ncbi:MAG TPA: acyl-CoA dehydrogenase family protein [Nevskiales bacterium]|nr:acyl-CoA dehydrogenase family protein [Nevskiales bacterium]